MTEERAQPLLRTKDLRKSFEHGGQTIEVLKGFDLEVMPGERVAIVGQSGAGKSTFLHVVGTLDVPTSGEIEVCGRDVVRMNSRQLADFRNRTIGFMFQFHHLLPEFTALENVMMPALIRRTPKREACQRAEKWLCAVGLGERLTHRPSELSGGEQQRVALARALVSEPALLLADEPTGNLDSITSAGIHELFAEINSSHGTTLLIVTHNRELAGRMPRKLNMVDGRLEGADASA